VRERLRRRLERSSFLGDGGFNEALNRGGVASTEACRCASCPVVDRASAARARLPLDPSRRRIPLAESSSSAHAPHQRSRVTGALRVQRGIGLDAEAVRRVDEMGAARRREGARATLLRASPSVRRCSRSRPRRFEPGSK